MFFILLSASCWGSDHNDELFNYSKKQEEVLVVKVAASDLIVLEDGRRIKLIGVDSVRLRHKYARYDDKGHVIEEQEEPVISLEEQALTYAQELLENKKVRLEFDVDGGDTSNGYLLAYVFLPDGRMANAELLRMGFVKLRIVPPNVKYQDQLRLAYQEAKKEKRGLQGD